MKVHIVYIGIVAVMSLATGMVVYAASPSSGYDDQVIENDWKKVVDEWHSLKQNNALSAHDREPYEERFTHIAGVRYTHELNKITLFYTGLRKKIVQAGIDPEVTDRLLAYVDGEIVWYDQREGMILRATTVNELTDIIQEMSGRWSSSKQHVNIVSNELSIGSVRKDLQELSSVVSSLESSVDALRVQGHDVSSFDQKFADIQRHIDQARAALEKAVEENRVPGGNVQYHVKVAVSELSTCMNISKDIVLSIRNMFPDDVQTVLPGVPTGYPALMDR